MCSIIIVEDEYMQRKILRKMLKSINRKIDVYEADSEISALDIIENQDIHINVFLIDIGLNESSGLELAIKIRNISKYEFTPIVFLTTHNAYLTRAFKQTHCYDYILKPYSESDVSNMLTKIINNEINKIDDMGKHKNKEIVIMLKNGIYVELKIDDIFFIEVKGKDCEVNTVNGVYLAYKIGLKKFVKIIDSEYIIQSHKSFAINLNYVRKIEKVDFRLSLVYFYECNKTAFLGYTFKDKVVSKFTKGKVLI